MSRLADSSCSSATDTGAQGRQRAGRRADDGLQRGLPGFEVVHGGDLLRDHQVVGGLGFMGVGNGLGADFEVALRRRQLLGHGFLLGAGRGQRVLGRQHVEVGLGHAGDQVLLGLGELGFRNRLLQLALLVGFPAVPAEQRLQQLDVDFLGGKARAARGHGAGDDAGVVDDRFPGVERPEVIVAMVDVTRDADDRQQPRTPLGDAFAARSGGSASACIGGVVRQSLLVHLEQIGRLGVEREKRAGQQHGDKGFLHYFLRRSHQ
jgi:hypothetical protein